MGFWVLICYIGLVLEVNKSRIIILSIQFSCLKLPISKFTHVTQVHYFKPISWYHASEILYFQLINSCKFLIPKRQWFDFFLLPPPHCVVKSSINLLQCSASACWKLQLWEFNSWLWWQAGMPSQLHSFAIRICRRFTELAKWSYWRITANKHARITFLEAEHDWLIFVIFTGCYLCVYKSYPLGQLSLYSSLCI